LPLGRADTRRRQSAGARRDRHGEVSLVAEKLNPAVQYRMERIPGYFPPKYRRVPVEP